MRGTEKWRIMVASLPIPGWHCEITSMTVPEEQTPETALQTLDLSTREIVAGAFAQAPPRVRSILLLSLASAGFVVVVALVDALTARDGLEPYRLLGIVLGMIGLTLLSVAMVLHAAGQRQSVSCNQLSWFRSEAKMFRLEAKSLDQMLLVLPVMAIVAGVLMAFAAGLLVPAVIDKPIFIVVELLFLFYLAIAVNTVRQSTRFLYRHAREQARAATQAQADAAEAQLAALQAQMNPHFLFNALNTVASLVRTDRQAAEATVENLAEVLRRTLARSRNGRGTVREEVDYLKAYLAVEKERWGERLQVRWSVAPDALDVALPPMTLQPLVENALKHGLGERVEGGIITIAARRENGVLSLQVEDNGIGFPARYQEGTGLGNLRQRLTTIFGDRAMLEIDSASAGATVRITIPAESPAAN